MLHAIVFARALYAMHEAGVLTDIACKPAVKIFIRQVSEDAHWHFSAHYRSKKAAAEVRKGKPRTKAQYQAFCRKNLRHEHMVPGEVVYQLLKRHEEPNGREDCPLTTKNIPPRNYHQERRQASATRFHAEQTRRS